MTARSRRGDDRFDRTSRVDRRKFIIATGGAAVALPLLGAESAQAGASTISVQHVSPDESDGNDANDGLSFRPTPATAFTRAGGPKRTIGAAIAALPLGGVIFLTPGDYLQDEPLVLNGHHLVGQAPRSLRNPTPPPPQTATSEVTIFHRFDGPLIDFQGGGSLKGVTLSNANGGDFKTGPAISSVATPSSQRGHIYVEDVVITSTLGWERDVVLDGSADPEGLRSTFFTNCQFFGATTSGETIVLNRCINSFWSNCEIIPAPLDAAKRQGIKILNAGTEEVYLNSCFILGNLYSEASGTGGVTNQSIHVGNSRITHDVTFASGSAHNRVEATVGGSVTNDGAPTNVILEPRWTPLTLMNGWTNYGGSTPTAAWARDAHGFINLRGFIKAPSGGSAVGTVLANLPVGARPTAFQEVLGAWASGGLARVDVVPGTSASVVPGTSASPGGDIKLQTAVGGLSTLSLGGLRFSIF